VIEYQTLNSFLFKTTCKLHANTFHSIYAFFTHLFQKFSVKLTILCKIQQKAAINSTPKLRQIDAIFKKINMKSDQGSVKNPYKNQKTIRVIREIRG